MATNCIGTVRAFPYSDPNLPAGWLVCNGRMLKKEDYPDLFKLIGFTYGSFNDDYFALPDLQGRVPLGVGVASPELSYAIGDKGGNAQVTLQNIQMPPHTHKLTSGRSAPKVSSNDGTQPGAAAGVSTLGRFNNAITGKPSMAYDNTTPGVVLNAGPALTASIQPTGDNEPIPVSQPTITWNYCICVQA